MNTIWSQQYRKPCVVASTTDVADAVIAACRASGAYVNQARLLPDGDGTYSGASELEFVVQLRDDAGPELWTETALRRSLGKVI